MLLELVLLPREHVDLRLQLHKEPLFGHALQDLHHRVRVGVEVAHKPGELVVVAQQLVIVGASDLAHAFKQACVFVALVDQVDSEQVEFFQLALLLEFLEDFNFLR